MEPVAPRPSEQRLVSRASRYEDPILLLRRLRIGREEYCQRLLTMLILGGRYPRWNTRSTPTVEGRRFLQIIDSICFGATNWSEVPAFIDEFELSRRHDDEPGGAPDYAIAWPHRLWVIELKTERASHRRGQLGAYYELARHHYPNHAIDLTYLTPPFSTRVGPPGPWARFSHITWEDTSGPLRQVWDSTEDVAERRVLEALLDALAHLDKSPSAWRRDTHGETRPPPAEPAVEPRNSDLAPISTALTAALELAEMTGNDGKQRALDYQAADLDALLALRLAVRTAIRTSVPDSSIRHVQPWLWRPESTGMPLTRFGGEVGYELRLSRTAKPVC